MQIHGTADGTVPFAGNALFMPVEDVVNHWVDFNSCNPVPVTTEIEDIDTDDGCTAIHYLYEDGALGTTVEFYKIIGGEHTWPGSIYGESITNQDFNASVEIWRFFSQYNLLQLTSSIEASASVFDFKVFPNPTNGPIQIEFDHIAERQIILSNYLGAKILVDNSVDKNYEINIENSGLYFITVIENGMSKTIKFIKN
jgi:polyhydroxybutyrate depolymerase